MDWTAKFDTAIHQYPDISKAHLFEFTVSGLRTKQYVDDELWNEWNNNPPTFYHLMLSKAPTGLLQPMKPYALGSTKKQDIQKALTYVPQESQEFLKTMSAGGLGFDLQYVDCLNDFQNTNNNASQSMPTVQVEFRKKRKHLPAQEPIKRKKQAIGIGISKAEVQDLLATQSPAQQSSYTNF